MWNRLLKEYKLLYYSLFKPIMFGKNLISNFKIAANYYSLFKPIIFGKKLISNFKIAAEITRQV